MRKLLVVLSASAFVALAFAAPAAAQRDPFDPLIEEGGTTTGVSSGTGTGVAPAPAVPVSGDGLANTGADPSPWLALAYVLIGAGAAAVAMSGVLRKPVRAAARN